VEDRSRSLMGAPGQQTEFAYHLRMRKILVMALIAVSISVVASTQAPAPMPDKEWKEWLDQVRPLMQPAETEQVKIMAPSQRSPFVEAFWQARNPNPSSAENSLRKEYEERARTAESRFRYSRKGRWNDCGRTWVLLGKPDATQLSPDGIMPSTPQPRQEGIAAEAWTYRRHPRLPNPPETLTFTFDVNCEAVDRNRGADRVLNRAAASYLTHAK
jgi:GWxTD domain-containing protein